MEIILFVIGGRLYTWIELFVRGHTHWTMFVLGGACFVVMGLLNEHIFPWDLSLAMQSIISAVIITTFEFLTGCIVNLWLGWNVWDYSNLPFNLFGQICLYFFFLWIGLSIIGIILDDWIRYLLYVMLRIYIPAMQERTKPRYKLL
jgi:uncharacterized membrane protein